MEPLENVVKLNIYLEDKYKFISSSEVTLFFFFDIFFWMSFMSPISSVCQWRNHFPLYECQHFVNDWSFSPIVERWNSGVLSQHQNAHGWLQVWPANRCQYISGALKPQTDTSVLWPGMYCGQCANVDFKKNGRHGTSLIINKIRSSDFS